jgi:hypothetical protein
MSRARKTPVLAKDRVPILAQGYVSEAVPLTIKIAQKVTDAFNRRRDVDPLDEIAASASKKLTDAGIPSEFHCDERLVRAKGFDERSPEWFAVKILIQILRCRSERKAAGFRRDWVMIRLGHLLCSSEIEVLHPGCLDHAVNLRRAVDDKNAVKKDGAGKRHEGWKSAAREEFRRHRKLSPSRCAERVIKKLKLSVTVDTVRKVIASEKKLASL